MNQRQLMAFRATMVHGSITAAAKVLSISQPAVSRLISDLEFSIGFPLFVRRAGRASPTREAQEFFAEVDMMFYGLDRLGTVAEEIRTLSRATVRLATLPMLALRVVPSALRRFRDSYPEARVLQDVYTSERVSELIASRQVELGVAQISQRREDIEILASFHARCVCVMTPDHPLAGEKRLTPVALENQPLITLARHTVSASYIANAFADHGIAPTIVAESQPSFAAGSLAAAGCGIAIIDAITARDLGGALVAVPLEPEIPFDIHLVKARGLPLSRAAEALAAEIRTEISGVLEKLFLS